MAATLSCQMLPGYVLAAPDLPASSTNSEPAAPMQVNRRPPENVELQVLPQFSKEPTSAEFFVARAFERPLVPIGTATVEENQALAAMLAQYVKRSQREDQSLVLDFLNQHPKSAWRPALLLNLGIYWREHGHFSKAIDAWQESWEASKGATDIRGETLANQALGQLLQIYTWVDAYDKLESLLSEIGNRRLMGGITETVSSARLAIWISKNRPGEGSKCGPYALQQLLSITQTNAAIDKIFEARASRQGFSLADLKQLAIESGMKYQMAKWAPGSEIPTNSVVHLKLNHYGALLKKDGDRYLMRDRSFLRQYGNELWLNQDALAEESDGYFLVPEGPLPAGWQSVSAEEGQKVWGSGQTFGPDTTAFGPNDCLLCTFLNSFNMARANAHVMLVSLHITDTPLYYQPAVGPQIQFNITYNQRDPTEQSPLISNLGPKWTFDWNTFICDIGAAGSRPVGSEVTCYGSGGGETVYSMVNPATGQYSTNRDGNSLQYNTGTDTYVLTFTDGSQQVFGKSIWPANSATRQVFLTKFIDPAGNYVTLNYDGMGRIAGVNDALGQTTTLYYDLSSDPYKITRVVDPFNRTAVFGYDELGRLRSSTDMIGMASVFGYDTGDFINTLTTPYGVSTFSYSEQGYTRTLLMTDPNGDREYLVYNDYNSNVPSSEPASAYPSGVPNLHNDWLNYRNTYYYDKKAMSLYGSDILSASPPADVWTHAKIYHWLHDNDGGLSNPLTS
jgi:YD repeat-containing protein